MSPISPEQWKALSLYLDQAMTLSDEELERWLQTLQFEQPEIAEKIRSLREHRAVEKGESFEAVPGWLAKSASAGDVVGAYRLVSPIGQGGMGTVWEARRNDGRFERKAAAKFLNLALKGRRIEERFRREGAILARLSHPNIAELLDAGVTGVGQPYLLLEYVEGEAIDTYCDTYQLNVAARLALFLDVLAAVSHAHANLIVHRDIKPSNVLVSKDGQVKLLDFGIAKLLDGDGAEGGATKLTQEAGSALTPQYAAPEQVTGGLITTATDVYALGLLLYLMLTGQHSTGPGPHSPAELLKAITEIEPLPLSDAVVSQTGTASANAARRGTIPERLRRELRGELEIIVAKALKKNPQERYTSVIAFAEDLQRYLRNEPIRARPDTVSYRTAKFVRRHRTAMVMATLALIATMAGLVGTLVQARTARQQRDAAIRERDRANRITEFMTNMFKVSDPYKPRGNSVTAREILDKAAQDIETGLAKDPQAQAHMMYVMGEVYDNLGLLPQAEPLLKRAAELQERVLGPEDPETLKSISMISVLLVEQGNLEKAEKLQSQTLAVRKRVLGAEHPDTVRSLARLASIYSLQGRSTEAVKAKREAYELGRRVFGPEHPDTLLLTNSLVSVLWSTGDESLYPEAEKLQRDALETERRVLGPEHPDTLNAMISLGVLLRRRGQFVEAEKLYRDTLSIQNRVLGPEHPDTLALRDSLAVSIAKQGRYREAEAMYRETRGVLMRTLGMKHPATANSTYNLACVAASQGHREEALALLNEALGQGLNANTALAMENDEDLQSLYGEPRFVALVNRAKKNAASQVD